MLIQYSPLSCSTCSRQFLRFTQDCRSRNADAPVASGRSPEATTTDQAAQHSQTVLPDSLWSLASCSCSISSYNRPDQGHIRLSQHGALEDMPGRHARHMLQSCMKQTTYCTSMPWTRSLVDIVPEVTTLQQITSMRQANRGSQSMLKSTIKFASHVYLASCSESCLLPM